MSRLRKLDQELLHQSALLDEDDQDHVIEALAASNDALLAFMTRWLTVLILVEMPLFLLARQPPLVTVTLVLSNLLTLVNTRYAVESIAVVPWARRLVLFWGLNAINAVLNLQLVFVHLAAIQVAPIFNLVMLVLTRRWRDDATRSVNGLRGLKYKYKSV